MAENLADQERLNHKEKRDQARNLNDEMRIRERNKSEMKKRTKKMNKTKDWYKKKLI